VVLGCATVAHAQAACQPAIQVCPSPGLVSPGPIPNPVIGGPPPTSTVQPKMPDLGGNIIPNETVSRYPLSHYEIYYDGGHFYDQPRGTYGFILSTAFDFMKLLVQLSSWIVTWAFTFGFAALLADPAAKLGIAFSKSVILPLGLGFLGLFATMIYAAAQLVQGRPGRAFREVLVTGLVLIFAGMLLVNPAKMLRDTNRTTSELSGQILSAANPTGQVQTVTTGSGAAHPEYGAYVSPQKAALTKAFVEEPWYLLNWGEVLDPNSTCGRLAEAILAGGPWGRGSTAPRDIMGSKPECQQYADFNADPGAQLRYMWAPFLGFIALIVLLVVCIVAGSVVAAQVIEAGLVAVEPFALVGGLFPGKWRAPLWMWARKGLGAIFAVLALSAFMTLLTAGITAVLNAETAQPLGVQIASLVVFVAIMIHLLRKFRHAGVKAGQGAVGAISKAATGKGGSKGKGEIGKGSSGELGAGRAALAGAGGAGLTLGLADHFRGVHGSTIEQARDFYGSVDDRVSGGVAGWKSAAAIQGDVKRASQRGAAIASVIPGVGTGVGAAVGGGAKILQLGAGKVKSVANDVSLRGAVVGGSIAQQKREQLEARLAGVDPAKAKEAAVAAAIRMVSPMARGTALATMSQEDPVRGADAHMRTGGVSRLATQEDADRAREWAADERTRRRVVVPVAAPSAPEKEAPAPEVPAAAPETTPSDAGGAGPSSDSGSAPSSE
jgi:hypothetical protein